MLFIPLIYKEFILEKGAVVPTNMLERLDMYLYRHPLSEKNYTYIKERMCVPLSHLLSNHLIKEEVKNVYCVSESIGENKGLLCYVLKDGQKGVYQYCHQCQKLHLFVDYKPVCKAYMPTFMLTQNYVIESEKCWNSEEYYKPLN